MPLPLIPLPTTTIEVGGQKVTIRSLSRGERLALADLDLDARGLEAYIVGRCTETPDEEAAAWLAAVAPDVADKLIADTMEWSGLVGPSTGSEEAAGEPEDPSSGSTEEQGSGEPSSEP